MEVAYKTMNKAIEYFLVFIFSLLVLDVIWQVVSRYLIGQSSSFTEEFARFALIWLAILGAAYLNGQRAHLSMDYLLRKLSPEALKKRLKIIEILMLLFALIVMVIGGGNLVYLTFILGQQSPAMGISLGFIYSIVPISGLIIIFYSIYNITRP
ncbi:TRAP transporter small permease [Portibacter lacus]|uniref:C4-dicarboxylate ABC transporter permease n=1 Tax=Portibacter lacus TaxID=1099794 RepID=A0AA37SUW6_9BACT|nr:TRAP transporter small permease [Portibacter lacus]GLR20029.1 C4-dicarboxylate ABC transporter permease [Portibacter lacus]